MSLANSKSSVNRPVQRDSAPGCEPSALPRGRCPRTPGPSLGDGDANGVISSPGAGRALPQNLRGRQRLTLIGPPRRPLPPRRTRGSHRDAKGAGSARSAPRRTCGTMSDSPVISKQFTGDEAGPPLVSVSKASAQQARPTARISELAERALLAAARFPPGAATGGRPNAPRMASGQSRRPGGVSLSSEHRMPDRPAPSRSAREVASRSERRLRARLSRTGPPRCAMSARGRMRGRIGTASVRDRVSRAEDRNPLLGAEPPEGARSWSSRHASSRPVVAGCGVPLEQCLPTRWPPRSVSAVICRATVLDVAQARCQAQVRRRTPH